MIITNASRKFGEKKSWGDRYGQTANVANGKAVTSFAIFDTNHAFMAPFSCSLPDWAILIHLILVMHE